MPPQQRQSDDGTLEFIAAHPFTLQGVNDGKEMVPGETYRAPRDLVRRMVDAGYAQAVGGALSANYDVFALQPGQKATAFAAPTTIAAAVQRGSAGVTLSTGAAAVLVDDSGQPVESDGDKGGSKGGDGNKGGAQS